MMSLIIATLAIFTGVTAEARTVPLTNNSMSAVEFRLYADGEFRYRFMVYPGSVEEMELGAPAKSYRLEALPGSVVEGVVEFDPKVLWITMSPQYRFTYQSETKSDYPSRFRKLMSSDVPDNMLSKDIPTQVPVDAIEEGDTEALRRGMLERRL